MNEIPETVYIFSDYEIRKYMMDNSDRWMLGIPNKHQNDWVIETRIEQAKSDLFSLASDEVTNVIKTALNESESEYNFKLVVASYTFDVVPADYPRLGSLDVYLSAHIFMSFTDHSEQIRFRLANPFNFPDSIFMTLTDVQLEMYCENATHVSSLDFPTK